MRKFVLVTAALVLATPGCGGFSGGGLRTVDPAQLQEIESLESRIDEERSELAMPSVSCDDQCRGTGAICDAAERICEIAAGVDDADVDRRCTRARDTCTAARERVTTGCACSAAAPADGAVPLAE
jgi:hypothetical protein